MMTIAITDWRQYLNDGEQFLKTALGAARKRPDVFTPEILYNLTGMAIEKFFMGFLMSRGDLAENHTMADLLRAVERHDKLPADLAGDLLFLDSFQEICDLETYSRRPPSKEAIERILATGAATKAFVLDRIPMGAA